MAKGWEARLADAEAQSENLPARCPECQGPPRGGGIISVMGLEDQFRRCPACKGPLNEAGPMGRLVDGVLILKRVLLGGAVPDDLTVEGAQRYAEARKQLEEELEDD